MHQRNGYASGTACVHPQGVVVAVGDPNKIVLAAFDHQGQSQWQRELGSFVSQHGFGGSPVVYDDLVIFWVSQDAEQLPEGQAPGDSRVLAFDVRTGKDRWTTSLMATRTCYSTPTLIEQDGRPALLLANTNEGISALDLATGKPLWNRHSLTLRSVSCPIVVGDLAIATEGAGSGSNSLFAVSLSGDHELVFSSNRNIPYVPTPVAKDDLLFLWSDKGIVTCLRLPQGDVQWSQRIGGNVSSSPVIAGNKLIGISEEGMVTILSATDQFANLGSVKLEQTVRSTPLLAQKYMLLRTDSKLLCIGSP
jgi:outer membrane protein assembly factor BamB